MKKFKGYVQTNIVGSRCEFEFELEDDCTQNDIEQAAHEAAMQEVDYNYEEIE